MTYVELISLHLVVILQLFVLGLRLEFDKGIIYFFVQVLFFRYVILRKLGDIWLLHAISSL